jgi:Domain of unknown function (DUF4271)
LRPMRLGFVISILFCWVFYTASGQSAVAGNPFEVSSRLPSVSMDSAGVSSGMSNPFDVVPHRIPGVSSVLESAANSKTEVQSIQLPKGNTIPKSFVFGILVLFLTFFTLAVGSNRSILLKAWRSFLSSNALNIAQREASGFSGNSPYLFLYINFLLNAGVFAYLIVQSLNSDGQLNNYAVFFLCLLGAIVVFVGKHLAILLLTWLFPNIAADLNRYNFLIIAFSCVLGFFLIPFNFVIAFAGTQNWQFFVTLWLIALAAIFIIYGVFRAFSLGTKYLFSYPLHFLLYLCAAEILPVLLLIKLLR